MGIGGISTKENRRVEFDFCGNLKGDRISGHLDVSSLDVLCNRLGGFAGAQGREQAVSVPFGGSVG